jgi:hypothetical protein
MRKPFYMNDFTSTLNKYFESKINNLIANESITKQESKSIFDLFIHRIHLESERIIKFTELEEKQRTSPLVVCHKKSNLTFILKIKKDLSSDFIITYTKEKIFSIDKNIILTKVKPIDGYVYFVKSEYGYKIGFTTNLSTRLNSFGVKLPFKVELHSYIQTNRYKEVEKFLHDILSEKRLNGEWFNLIESDFEEIDIIVNNMLLERVINKA